MADYKDGQQVIWFAPGQRGGWASETNRKKMPATFRGKTPRGRLVLEVKHPTGETKKHYVDPIWVEPEKKYVQH